MLEFLGALWNFLLKLCAIALCAAFDLAVVIVVVLLIADRMLLSPDLYVAALERQQIYQRLPSLAAEQIYMQLHNSQAESNAGSPFGMQNILANLNTEQIDSILTELLPSDWLQGQTNSILEQAFYVINTPSAPLQINVSMAEFKNRLEGQAGLNAVLDILNALPPCTSEQIISMAASGMPECRPPDALVEATKPLIAAGLKQAANKIPDQIDLLESARANGVFDLHSLGLPAGPRVLLQAARWLVRFSPLVCLVILLLMALLVVRSWFSLLRWWGAAILSAGVSTVVAALAVWIGVEQAFSITRENLPLYVSPGLFDAISGVISSVVVRVALMLGGAGALIAAVGLILLIIAFFLARAQRKKPESFESRPPESGNTSLAAPARLQEPPDRPGVFG